MRTVPYCLPMRRGIIFILFFWCFQSSSFRGSSRDFLILSSVEKSPKGVEKVTRTRFATKRVKKLVTSSVIKV